MSSTFGAATAHRAAVYERFGNWIWLLSQLALLAVLVVYARRGARFAKQSAAGPIGTGMLLGMIGLALVWLIDLPFGLAQHWWNRRHHVSSEGYLAWATDDWAQLGAEFLSICLALLIVMAIARKLPNAWWLPGTVVFVAIGSAFQLALPYIVSIGTKPLRNPAILADVRADEKAQGLPNIPVRVEKVSDTTDEVNAFAVGIGPTRRVVVWDTLLDGRYPNREVNIVLAHELGHQSSDHIPKGLAWYALFALPGTYLIARATRRRGGMARAEAVPLGLLVVAVLQLAATPAQAFISRRMEAEADWKALQTTHDPRSMRSLFVSFARADVSDPSPPTWAYILLEDHPTLEQRVAMAEAWAKRQPPAS